MRRLAERSNTVSAVRWLAARWLLGGALATGLVWWSGPWWLDSILVFERDELLEAHVLRPGQRIRWRSEGWGDTRVGPHGLPGWAGPDRAAEARVVLWGDSQLEGLCLDDPLKIHRLARERLAVRHGRRVDVVPAGRSGSDARDWLAMMPRFERLGAIDLHGWIVTEFVDLEALADARGAGEPSVWERRPLAMDSRERWSAMRMEFLFHAVRNLIYDPDAARIRSLRWSVGPAASDQPAGVGQRGTEGTAPAGIEWGSSAGRLVVFYAPAVPRFTLEQGVVAEDPEGARFEQLAGGLQAAGVTVVDLRPVLVEAYERTGRLPRGFPNGLLGYGHLNETGNRAVASAVADVLADRLSR